LNRHPKGHYSDVLAPLVGKRNETRLIIPNGSQLPERLSLANTTRSSRADPEEHKFHLEAEHLLYPSPKTTPCILARSLAFWS